MFSSKDKLIEYISVRRFGYLQFEKMKYWVKTKKYRSNYRDFINCLVFNSYVERIQWTNISYCGISDTVFESWIKIGKDIAKCKFLWFDTNRIARYLQNIKIQYFNKHLISEFINDTCYLMEDAYNKKEICYKRKNYELNLSFYRIPVELENIILEYLDIIEIGYKIL